MNCGSEGIDAPGLNENRGSVTVRFPIPPPGSEAGDVLRGQLCWISAIDIGLRRVLTVGAHVDDKDAGSANVGVGRRGSARRTLLWFDVDVRESQFTPRAWSNGRSKAYMEV